MSEKDLSRLGVSAELEKWVIGLRRDFHAFPELAFEEKETARKIAAVLENLGLEVQTGVGRTGVVGLLRGAGPGKTIALRADIDALPVVENNDVAYRSRNVGVMHACGHDAHAAVMLGVARLLTESGFARTLAGNVKFIFQPAEEKLGGARAMIGDGVLENPRVDMVIAGHVTSDLPAGTVGIFGRQSHTSSDRLELVFHGRGGHAASPEKTVDPIVAAAYFVTQVQSVVSRSVGGQETAVITIGVFEAGTAHNIIPAQAMLKGTVRCLDEKVRRRVRRRILAVARGIKRSMGLPGLEVDYIESCPASYNDPRANALLRETGVKLLGAANVRDIRPSNGSEDFAFYAVERPAAIMRLGTAGLAVGGQPGHGCNFDVDETALKVGVGFFARAVREYFTRA